MSQYFWQQHLEASSKYELAANVLASSGSLRAARLLQTPTNDFLLRAHPSRPIELAVSGAGDNSRDSSHRQLWAYAQSMASNASKKRPKNVLSHPMPFNAHSKGDLDQTVQSTGGSLLENHQRNQIRQKGLQPGASQTHSVLKNTIGKVPSSGSGPELLGATDASGTSASMSSREVQGSWSISRGEELDEFGIGLHKESALGSEKGSDELNSFGLNMKQSPPAAAGTMLSFASKMPVEAYPSGASVENTPHITTRRRRVRKSTSLPFARPESGPASGDLVSTIRKMPKDMRTVYAALYDESSTHVETDVSLDFGEQLYARIQSQQLARATSSAMRIKFAYDRPIRAKIVSLSGMELMHLTLWKVYVAGLCLKYGRQSQLSRRSSKVFCLGHGIQQLKKHQRAKTSAKIFSVGVQLFSKRMEIALRHCTKIFAVGVLSRVLKSRKTTQKRSKTPKTTARLHWNTDVAKTSVSGSVFDRSGRRASVMLPGGSHSSRSRTSLGMLLDPSFVEQAAEEFKLAKKKTTSIAPKSAKATKTTFFSGSSARNYGISLTRCLSQQSFSELAEALLSMNTSKLKSSDTLESLVQLDIFDETAAIRSIRSFKGQLSELQVADQFVKEVIINVPSTKLRIRCLLFLTSYKETVQQCQKVGTLMLQCCRTVRHSGALEDVLGLMLRLGKQIQAAGGGDPDSVSGFKVTSLCSLMKSKAPSGKTFGELLIEGILATRMCLTLRESCNPCFGSGQHRSRSMF